MNLVLFEAGEVDAAGVLRVRGRRARHLLSVLRVGPGATVRVGQLGGASGQGTVVAVGEGEVALAVELTGAPAARPPVDLVVALPRPKALPRLLQSAAALGVGRIDLVNAWRVDKAYWGAPLVADAAALRAALLEGCEQGATTWLPALALHRLFVPFIDGLPAPGPDRVRLVGHPRAARPIEAAARGRPRALLAIGPEGGWIDRELASLDRVGFAPVSLGPFVLRVETALAVALGQLALLRRLDGGTPDPGGHRRIEG